ncbi:Uu.00g144940.m01.CDS01 [Anthostomella pinea]|uniref:Uu.00g144940.m01.CDS01 n=1 Tax=Anthostomella pinea TaxID=933095 RepID=A0AAI8YLP4_9PEZI|nr:Uu.00g144940.m01.CDS01 [Anthostomella pinea]
MAEAASIRFLKWDPIYEKERPFQIFMDLLPDAKDLRKTNISWDEEVIGVQDFRDQATDFHLDTHGFTSRRLPGFTELSDKDTIQGKYIPEIKAMLQRELGDVGTVFVFDWRIRSSRDETTTAKINFSDQTQPLLPSNYAHIDAGPMSVLQRIQNSFPNDAARILRQRIRAVNVWKPLSHPVEEWALAVCDGTTVKPDDLVETDSIRQGSISTNYYVKYDEGQKWYFLKDQKPDETLLFKHFDSEPGVEAPFALHSSIRHHHVAENARPRRSIEVRTLIFSERFEGVGGC